MAVITKASYCCDVLCCMWQLISRPVTAVMYSTVEGMQLISRAVITVMHSSVDDSCYQQRQLLPGPVTAVMYSSVDGSYYQGQLLL